MKLLKFISPLVLTFLTASAIFGGGVPIPIDPCLLKLEAGFPRRIRVSEIQFNQTRYGLENQGLENVHEEASAQYILRRNYPQATPTPMLSSTLNNNNNNNSITPEDEKKNEKEEEIIEPNNIPITLPSLLQTLSYNGQYFREQVLPSTLNNCGLLGIYGPTSVYQVRQRAIEDLLATYRTNQRVRYWLVEDLAAFTLDEHELNHLPPALQRFAPILRNAGARYLQAITEEDKVSQEKVKRALSEKTDDLALLLPYYIIYHIGARLNKFDADYIELTAEVLAAVAATQGADLLIYERSLQSNGNLILAYHQAYSPVVFPELLPRIIHLLHTTADKAVARARNHFNLLVPAANGLSQNLGEPGERVSIFQNPLHPDFCGYSGLEQHIDGYYTDRFILPRDINDSGLCGIYGRHVERTVVLEELAACMDKPNSECPGAKLWLAMSICDVLKAQQTGLDTLPREFLEIHEAKLRSLIDACYDEQGQFQETKLGRQIIKLYEGSLLKDYVRLCLRADANCNQIGKYDEELPRHTLVAIAMMKKIDLFIGTLNEEGFLEGYTYRQPNNAQANANIYLLHNTDDDSEDDFGHYDLLVPTELEISLKNRHVCAPIQEMGTLPAAPTFVPMRNLNDSHTPGDLLMRMRIHPSLVKTMIELGAEVYAQRNVGVDNPYEQVFLETADSYNNDNFISLIFLNLGSLYEAFHSFPELEESLLYQIDNHYGSPETMGPISQRVIQGQFNARSASQLESIQEGYIRVFRTLAPILEKLRKSIDNYILLEKGRQNRIQQKEGIPQEIKDIAINRFQAFSDIYHAIIKQNLDSIEQFIQIVHNIDHTPAGIYALLASAEWMTYVMHSSFENYEQSENHHTPMANMDSLCSICSSNEVISVRHPAEANYLLRQAVEAEELEAVYIRRINWIMLYLYHELSKIYFQEFGAAWNPVRYLDYQRGYNIQKLFKNLWDAYSYVSSFGDFSEALEESLKALDLNRLGEPLAEQTQPAKTPKYIYEEYKSEKHNTTEPSLKLSYAQRNDFYVFLGNNLSSQDFQSFENFLALRGNFTTESLDRLFKSITDQLKQFLIETFKHREVPAQCYADQFRVSLTADSPFVQKSSSSNSRSRPQPLTEQSLMARQAALINLGLIPLGKFKNPNIYKVPAVQTFIDEDENGDQFEEEINKILKKDYLNKYVKQYRRGILEYKFDLRNRTARIIYMCVGEKIVVLHAFYKTTEKISAEDNAAVNRNLSSYLKSQDTEAKTSKKGPSKKK